MIYKFALKINENEVSDEVLNKAAESLPTEMTEKIRRFVFKKDKLRSLGGYLLLRYILKKKYSKSPDEYCIAAGAYGKPYFSNIEGIHFNISHSGELVVCAVGDIPLGIDVQNVDRHSSSMIRSVCSDDEYQYLIRLSEQESAREFIHLWSLKESYAKCIGKGLSIPFDTLSFKVNNGHTEMKINGIPEENYSFGTVEYIKDHFISLCIEKSDIMDIAMDINEISLKELL